MGIMYFNCPGFQCFPKQDPKADPTSVLMGHREGYKVLGLLLWLLSAAREIGSCEVGVSSELLSGRTCHVQRWSREASTFARRTAFTSATKRSTQSAGPVGRLGILLKSRWTGLGWGDTSPWGYATGAGKWCGFWRWGEVPTAVSLGYGPGAPAASLEIAGACVGVSVGSMGMARQK